MTRGVVVLAVAGIAAVLVGCYGSTEPATNFTESGATLNGRGTANSGPASTYFEYWPTGVEAAKQKTPERTWPAGASGPFSEPVTGLTPGLPYSFRLCGHDTGRQPVCAQTRGLWDSASGSFFRSDGVASVSARSDPSGKNPSGTIQIFAATLPRTWNVTCLAIAGNRAIIGGVRTPGDGILFAVENDSLVFGSRTVGDTPDCAATDFSSLPKVTATAGSATVHDDP